MRTQLESIVRELRMRLDDIIDPSHQEQLLQELDQLEKLYRQELRSHSGR